MRNGEISIKREEADWLVIVVMLISNSTLAIIRMKCCVDVGVL